MALKETSPPHSSKVLGVDASMNKVGLCALDLLGRVIYAKKIEFTNLTHVYRVRLLDQESNIEYERTLNKKDCSQARGISYYRTNMVTELCLSEVKKLDPLWIAVEYYSLESKGLQFDIAEQVGFLKQRMAQDLDGRIINIPPRTIKSFICGAAIGVKKEDLIAGIRESYQIDFKSEDDIADAFALARLIYDIAPKIRDKSFKKNILCGELNQYF